MRILLLAAVCFSARAQAPEVSAGFSAGVVSVHLPLNIPAAPEATDRIHIGCASGALRVTLLTPEGRRVTPENAAAAGFSWHESRVQQPDRGKAVVISFRYAGKAGEYAIDIAGKAVRPGDVRASFAAGKSHEAVLSRAFPAAVVASPAHGAGAIDLVVKENEKGSLIDVLVSDPSQPIALALPGGKTVTAESAAASGVEWRTTDDPFTQTVEVGRLLLAQPGTHHLLYFKQLARGTYRVRAAGAGGRAPSRALFLPFQRGWQRYLDDLYSGKPHAGRISIQPWSPPTDCIAGEPLELLAVLEGDAVREPAVIEAFAEPGSRPANLTFVRGDDGRYRAAIVPSQPGPLRLTLRASGRTAAGVPFADERKLAEILVRPRPAQAPAPAPATSDSVVMLPGAPAQDPAVTWRHLSAAEERRELREDSGVPGCPVSLISPAQKGEQPREGRVLLSIRTDEQGRARDVAVLRSSDQRLRQKAIDYVTHCGKYPPGIAQTQVEVVFRVM